MLLNLVPSNQYSYCQYWPLENNDTLETGQLTIRKMKEVIIFNFVVTIVHVSDRSGVSCRICHFLYTDWAIDGYPDDAARFYKFVLKINQVRTFDVRKFNLERIGPVILHCETGISRTGTFCTIDIALCQMITSGMISLPKIVISIRQQRHSSITIFEQYFFCYRVRIYCLSRIFKKLIII